jgi:hypothetical protein
VGLLPTTIHESEIRLDHREASVRFLWRNMMGKNGKRGNGNKGENKDSFFNNLLLWG